MVKDVGTLAVYLTMPRDDFNKGVKEAQRDIAKLSSTIGTFAVAGAAAITAFAVKSVMSFSQQEDAINDMNAALSAAGDDVEKYSSKFQAFTSEMQSRTIFGDEQVLGVMAYGKAMGIAADQLEEAGRAAIGLAAKYNIDLNTSMGLIAKANLGNTTALKRYGVILDENMTKEEKFTALLKIGGESFSLAEAKTKTLSGSLAQLENNFGEVEEAIGKMISQSLNLTTKMGLLANIAMKSAQFIENLDDTTKNAIVKITALATGITTLVSSWKLLNYSGLIPNISALGKWISLGVVKIAQDIKETSSVNQKVSALMAELNAQKLLNKARADSVAASAVLASSAARTTLTMEKPLPWAVSNITGAPSLASANAAAIASAARISATANAAAIASAGTLGLTAIKSTAGISAMTTAMNMLKGTAMVTGKILAAAFSGVTGPIGVAATLITVFRHDIAEWLVGVKNAQKESNEWDEKLKALPALGSRGIMSGVEAVRAQAEAAKKYLEDFLKPSVFNPETALNMRKLQDEIKIAGMADETLQDKLLIIAQKRADIMRESTNVINSTGDAIKDQESEEKRLHDLRVEDVKLQIDQNKLIKQEHKNALDAQLSLNEKITELKLKNAKSLDEKLKIIEDERTQAHVRSLYNEQSVEEKLKMEMADLDFDQRKKDLQKEYEDRQSKYVAPRLAGAIEKGTVEAYRAELAGQNQDTALFQKTEKNTEQTAKGVNQLVQSFKPFANMGVA
ncbi:MAG: hypothetical protein WCX65_19770 [bacterium]